MLQALVVQKMRPIFTSAFCPTARARPSGSSRERDIVSIQQVWSSTTYSSDRGTGKDEESPRMKGLDGTGWAGGTSIWSRAKVLCTAAATDVSSTFYEHAEVWYPEPNILVQEMSKLSQTGNQRPPKRESPYWAQQEWPQYIYSHLAVPVGGTSHELVWTRGPWPWGIAQPKSANLAQGSQASSRTGRNSAGQGDTSAQGCSKVFN